MKPTFFRTMVESIFWKEWYKENEKKPRFDVNESLELGWVSKDHFTEFIKFSSQLLDSSWKKRHSKLLKKYNKLLAKTNNETSLK